MDYNEVFPNLSNSLKKEDLPKPAKVVIESVEVVEFDEGPKLRLNFKGKEKHLICNKTNARTIASMHGNDTDGWMGKEIVLYNDPNVSMGDKIVGGIRVQYTPPGMDELDDDIPF